MFEVQTYMLLEGWVNCWTDIDDEGNETPSYYKTKEEAQAAIDEFFDDIEQAVKDGDMEDGYDRKDYRVMGVNLVSKYVCSVCSSEDIETKMWVNMNTLEVNGDVYEDERKCFCNNCEDHTYYKIIDVKVGEIPVEVKQ